ncbi:hypothetical protein ACWFRM_40355 [Streptomyces sp. NPDC055144]
MWGRTVTHTDLPGDAYTDVLRSAGLPEAVATLLVDVDVAGVAR